jgi:hypothetical protein
MSVSERVQCCDTQVVTFTEHHHREVLQVGEPDRTATGKRVAVCNSEHQRFSEQLRTVEALVVGRQDDQRYINLARCNTRHEYPGTCFDDLQLYSGMAAVKRRQDFGHNRCAEARCGPNDETTGGHVD